MDASLSSLLDSLQQQGELDSQGAFTLDPARARELLRSCQLAEPHLYILSLASALIGLGASSLQLTCRPDSLQLKAPGANLNPELVVNPLGGLFSRTQPALRELAVGINSALTDAGSRVELTAGDRRGFYCGNEFRWESGGIVEPQVTLTIKRAHQGQEAVVLARDFAQAPVALIIDGVRQLVPLVVPPDGCGFLFRPPQTTPATTLNVSLTANLYECPQPAPLQACLAIGAGPSACHWIFLGRTYRRPLPFELEGSDLPIQLWVACDQVDKDLSLEHILDNDRYARVCAYLRQCTLEAIESFWEQFLEGAIPAARAASARPLLVYAVEVSAAAGRLDQAREFQRALAKLPSSETARMQDRYRMALLYRQACETPLLREDSSLDDYWALIRARLAMLDSKDPTTLSMMQQCGQRALARQRYDLGVKALQPYLKHLPDDVGAQTNLGICWLNLGALQPARDLLSRAVSGSKSTGAIEAMEHLATAEARLGNLKAAATVLAEVLRERQKQWGSRSCRLGLLLNRLALLCEQLQDQKTARYYQEWSRSLHTT